MTASEKFWTRVVAAVVVAMNTGCGAVINSPSVSEDEPGGVFEGPVTRADCGPGSNPETDIQGRVSIDDRQSGRSKLGYRCNLELVGQYQGNGASWMDAWYDRCMYYGTVFPGVMPNTTPGTVVVDASDPTKPVASTRLTSLAMIQPWESLKVSDRRGLLGGVAGEDPVGNGPAFFDLYDVATDCAHPLLKASLPIQLPTGHEAAWSQDGNTYWASSLYFQTISPIDTTDPANPRPVTYIPMSAHGLSISENGERAYFTSGIGGPGNGLLVVDVSQVQKRAPAAQVETLGSVTWTDGSTAQSTIPVTIQGKPFVIFFDEQGQGAARIIDISDETKPVIVSKLKLEIHMEDAAIQRSVDTGGGVQGYQAHYCSVDQLIEPTVLGCGYANSGLRIFDIRNPYSPKEIAYFNPPAQIGKQAMLTGSQSTNSALGVSGAFGGGGDATTDCCTAQVRFVKERGEVWSTCMDNGFMVLKFTNGVWPFKD